MARLEKLDANRKLTYQKLVGLQGSLNAQVERFGQEEREAPRRGLGRPRKKPTVARRGPGPKLAITRKGKKGRTVTCNICKMQGRNARGHANWQSKQEQLKAAGTVADA